MIMPLDVTWDKMTDQQFISFLQSVILRDKFLMIFFLLGGLLLGWCIHKAWINRNKEIEKNV